MRTLYFILTIILTGITISLFAQECSFYYPEADGAELTYQHYDKKDKPSGKTSHIVNNYRVSGNSASATITVKGYDEKDKPAYETTLEVKCEEGVFYFDMKAYMNQLSTANFEEMDVNVETTDLEIPNSLKIGDKLKDGTLNMSVSSSGFTIMNLTIRITGREVLAKENVSVPAGNFDSYKISQVVETSGPMRFTTTSNEWICEGVGMVKSESYGKNGEVSSRSELIQLKR